MEKKTIEFFLGIVDSTKLKKKGWVEKNKSLPIYEPADEVALSNKDLSLPHKVADTTEIVKNL